MNFKHGQKRQSGATKLYRIHHNIVQRCTRKSCPSWKDYGGRGITIDPRWMDFSVFSAEIPPTPSDSHTLDRIDNNKGYFPGNIRWVTRLDQANNKRNNIRITIDGVTKTLPQWCRDLGRNYWTVKTRIFQGGLDPVDAVKKPTISKHAKGLL